MELYKFIRGYNILLVRAANNEEAINTLNTYLQKHTGLPSWQYWTMTTILGKGDENVYILA